jgi:hypothetical protein
VSAATQQGAAPSASPSHTAQEGACKGCGRLFGTPAAVVQHKSHCPAEWALAVATMCPVAKAAAVATFPEEQRSVALAAFEKAAELAAVSPEERVRLMAALGYVEQEAKIEEGADSGLASSEPDSTAVVVDTSKGGTVLKGQSCLEEGHKYKLRCGIVSGRYHIATCVLFLCYSPALSSTQVLFVCSPAFGCSPVSRKCDRRESNSCCSACGAD